MAQRLGLFGGTFDPIHFGHLAIAEAAREELCLDRVWFVPARLQPHKRSRRVTDAEHRWEMVRLALAGNPCFEPSRLELNREGPSYTADTVAEVRRQAGPGQEIFFICGADTLLELDSWYRPADLMAWATIAVARRPGCEDTAVTRAAAQLEARFGGRVVLFEAPLLDVSSSLIRERLAAGRSIRYLVADGVREYIVRNCLYRKGI